MTRFITLSAALLPALFGCKQDNSYSRVHQTDVFYQEPTNQVDILWVVDNSLSMGNEQEELATRFKEYILSMDSSEMDWHVGIVTTDLESPNQSGRLQGDVPYLTRDTPDYEKLFKQTIRGMGVSGSDQEAGIDAAYVALTEPLVSTDNAGFLRDEAKLNIIYVSDENDCSARGALDDQDGEGCYYNSQLLVPIVDLVADYKTLKTDDARVLVSAIVGPQGAGSCEGAVPGYRYLSMSEAFGGLQGSICSEDFSQIMGQLGLQTAGLYTSFVLSYQAVEDTLEIYVDDVLVAESDTNGWIYEPTYSVLYFYGDAVPDYGSTITVQYEVAGSRAEQDSGAAG